MKRRDFLKKAGLAIAAAPILVRAEAAPPKVTEVAPPKVVPNDPTFFPAKYLFDRPEIIAQTRNWERKSGPARVFANLDQQTKFLQRHFAEYDEWQWQDRTGEVRVNPGKYIKEGYKETHINFRGWDLYVELGTKITPIGDEIRIVCDSSNGNKFDWRWKPVLIPHDRVYTVGYRDNLLLACDKRPELGTVVAFTFAGPRYTIIEASPVATGVCSVLLDRPLEAKVFSNKYWIVKHWHRVMRAILDESLRTVTIE